MAVYREPISKKCKSLGISPAVLGYTHKKETRRKFGGGSSRRKISEYGLQLKEKQKLKFIYGVLEKQFYHYYELAVKEEGVTGENLLALLESRLDNVVFRMNMAITRREARQLVGHGHFTVNGKKVDIPSYRVKTGDVVALCERGKKSPKFAQIAELTRGRPAPRWLEVNRENQSATVAGKFQREELDYEIQEHLVIELYSK
ncbi:MAG: 30S ribosomal protein S4 [Oscillospiraceae bacterium]|jgi:small subunit ribosomal protein S4|nr:30S ribosomal protein S4 [Oscillospiraceae bacterium]